MTDVRRGPRGLVVIGASAGGVEALSTLAAALPPDLQAAVLVTLHIPPFAQSTLPAILNRAGNLPAAQASDSEPLRAGRIYVAPPDRHLLVRPGRVRVTRGPRENGHRPAVDSLFRSAALAYGPAVIGVVLTGILDDGAAGILAIKSAGGVAIVQSDAAYPDMPNHAMDATTVDFAVALDEMAAVIANALADLPEPRVVPAREDVNAPYQVPEERGEPTEITCPACGGVLTITGEDPLRFRCRVGHAYNVDSLLVGQDDALEQSLWAALRALEERGALLDRLSSRFAKRGNKRQAERFAEDRDFIEQRAAIVRRALLDPELTSAEATISTTNGDTAVENEPEDVAG